MKFNNNVEKINDIVKMYSKESKASNRLSFVDYENLKVLEKYIDNDIHFNNKPVYESYINRKRKKEFYNVMNNFLFFNSFASNIIDEEIGNIETKELFDDKYMYMLITSFFEKYDRKAVDLFARLISDEAIIEVDKINSTGNVSYISSLKEGFILFENNHDINTVTNLIRDIEVLKQIIENRSVNNDYSRVIPTLISKEFIDTLPKTSMYDEYLENYYKVNYVELRNKIQVLKNILKYTKYSELLKDKKEEYMDYISFLLGDLISEQLLELDDETKNECINYLINNDKNKFDSAILRKLKRTETGIVECVNKKYVKSINANKI